MLRQDTIPVLKPLSGSWERKTNVIIVQLVSDEIDKVDTHIGTTNPHWNDQGDVASREQLSKGGEANNAVELSCLRKFGI